ncbi:MAG TPA: rhodanese-like domain-containing protein [Solirubrobacterales bacterium]|jgi:glyoxylase-like metal-dependent hydrolase (beta-lactamase superfamily II)/rhodanese-related sulfurtransferase|nr:rhodanese-like domain-containing protein [Solirubrobacterales bacterium]
MLFRQIIHEDLGCASYLVSDRESGVAAIVDPQWDIEPYRRLARLHGVRIEHVLETHNHADHVSGHGRLARSTGAKIHIHELAEAEYEHEPFADGWVLELGDLRIEAIHTPGHRPEHTCFLLSDRSREGAPWALLSGDSLFIGDVARPDLAIEPREGAAEMFRSLHRRLLSLPDEVEVWPGHLGGSLCGGSGLDLKTSSTIGFERRHNRALAIADEGRFIENAVGSLGDKPPNVAKIVSLNRGPLVDDFGIPVPLTPHEIEEAVAAGACVIDGRTNEQFDEAHIAGALSTSAYDTGFATKVSRVAPPGAEIIVVAASDGDERAAAELLAAVGMRVRGFLEGGMTAWRTEERPVRRIELIDPEELARRTEGTEPPLVLDVRNASEYASEHIPGSLHIPYGQLAGRLDELSRDRQIATICRGGKRSGLAASILQREGFDVVHVGQGVGVWRAGGHPVESGVGQAATAPAT